MNLVKEYEPHRFVSDERNGDCWQLIVTKRNQVIVCGESEESYLHEVVQSEVPQEGNR